MPNWDNYIMRKHGQSIRHNIAECFGGFAKAVVAVRKELATKAAMEVALDEAARRGKPPDDGRWN